MTLLDTHVLLWLMSDNPRLAQDVRKMIERSWSEGEAGASAISFWEMAMSQQKGRLRIMVEIGQVRENFLRQGLKEIAVSGEIGIRAVSLPDFHKDPADRLIVATALEGDHRLVTADGKILAWPGPLRRLPAGV